MPVEKRHESGFRARLKVQQKWYHGPKRFTEQEAHEDLQKLEAARSEPADVLQSLVTELKLSGSAEARSACVQRRGETFRARVKRAGHTYFGPQRLTEAEAEEDAQKLSHPRSCTWKLGLRLLRG